VKPFVVEFLGTQGSGKTTLLPTVVSFLRENGLQAYTPSEAARPYALRTMLGRLVGSFAPVSIHKPLLWQIYYRTSMLSRISFNRKNRLLVRFVQATQQARPSGAGVQERRILFWFSHLCGTYTFLSAHARENEALVFDDGFVHRAVHLNASFVETPDPENITRYLALIPLPDLLIVPRVPLHSCVARVTSRGIWDHFRGRTQDELSRYLANSEYVVNLAVHELRRSGCSVIEVDNSDADMQKNIADLREKLRNMQLTSRLS
jgi:hypothetical protein